MLVELKVTIQERGGYAEALLQLSYFVGKLRGRELIERSIQIGRQTRQLYRADAHGCALE